MVLLINKTELEYKYIYWNIYKINKKEYSVLNNLSDLYEFISAKSNEFSCINETQFIELNIGLNESQFSELNT